MSTTTMRTTTKLHRSLLRPLMGALLLVGSGRVAAQIAVAAQTDLQQLAAAITGTGVQISNPVITCHSLGFGEYTYSGSGMDLTQGVILTSGRITDAIGPNNSTGSGTWFAQNTAGDPLLDAVTGRTTRDACKFEFDIIPTGDSLRFDFTFASEEYNEWVGSQFNDVFGFFISGPGIAGDPGAGSDHNIALVPGTATPVTINNVNNGSNSAYYQDNTGGLVTEYDGYTQDISAKALVQPCGIYHLKLIIADATDRKFDSGVFIEKIQSPTISMTSFTANGTPDMVEGCNPGWVRFDRGSASPTALTLQYFLQGTATNGTDYTAITPTNILLPKFITIPAGQSYVDQPVNPLGDALGEPTEYLKFILGNPNCPGVNLDTLIFNIVDTLIATATPGGTICLGGSWPITVTGGANYSWTPTTGLSCTACPNPIASPSTTTTYQVHITDGTCSRYLSRQVRVSNLALSAVVTQPLCAGQTNGAINLSVSNGYAPYAYSWTGPGGFTANSEDITNLAPGTYTVTVSDAACTRSASYNVIAPALLTVPLLPSLLPFGQNIACFGGSDGSIDATINGGTGPYSVVWNGPGGFTSGSLDINGLTAGLYTINVTDANGCTATGATILTQTSQLIAGILSSTSVDCYGDNDGIAILNVLGGLPPYNTTWTTIPPQTGLIAVGLAPGNYTAVVNDSYGCSNTVNVTIGGPTQALATALTAQTNVLCFGGNTGSASISISGGTAPYTTVWNTFLPQFGTTASNLSAGSYTATVTDAHGCSITRTVVITQPASALSASLFAHTNVLCRGNNTGSATVTASGGTGPYTYQWNTVPVQNTATASNLVAGSYTCTVRDVNNCSTTVSVTITQPAAVLAGSISASTNVLCFGNSTGSATVSVSGGTAPYGYSWNSSPVQTTATASNLPAGSYTCTITDANGCSITRNVTITQPAATLSASISASNNVLCFGNSTGSATVSVSGGTAPYGYSWNSSPVQTTATASNLPAGSYTCTITDANGCSITRNVTITQPAATLAASISASTNVLCFGNSTGSATVSVSGGTAPYGYSWNSSPVQTTATASNLPAGSYTCTITDANGCSITRNVTITQPAATLAASISASTNVLCFGNSTGSATVSISGGTAPYGYSWNSSPVQTTATASNLPAGSYTCTITDANGCSITRNVTITQPAAALTISGTVTPASCGGSATGAVNATTTGGTTPYGFAWSGPGAFSASTEDITALTSGVYTLTVTDANGCSNAQSFNVGQPGFFSISGTISSYIGGVEVSCAGATDGSISQSVSGGTAPYGYSWTGPGAYTAGTEDIAGLAAGTYVFVLTDANGCSTSATYTLDEPDALIASASSPTVIGGTNIACNGAFSGSIDGTISGGTAPYSIAWSGPGGFTSSSIDLSGLQAGTYNLNITDANGCSTSTSITLTQPAALAANISAQTNVGCFGNTTGSAAVSTIGGTAPLTYSWNTVPVQTGATASGLPAGGYTCTITDANACSTTASATITQPAAALGASITAQTNVLIYGQSTGAATVTATNGTSPYSYLWSNGQTSGTATNLNAGSYSVTVTDANDCSISVNVTITQPGGPLIASIASQTDVLCFGNSTGSATANATGGVGPYSYSWNTSPIQNSATAISLPAGTWTCTVNDANGATTTVSVTIAQPAAALGASITTQINVDCFGNNTGSATITATGGTPLYSFSWNTVPVQTSATATNMPAGSYTCTITDANGCSTSQSVTIAQPAVALSAAISAQTNVDCFGNTTGSATADASSGTAPYNYSWNTSPTQNTATASNLIAGTWTCSITDAQGCITSVVATITQPAATLGVNIGTVQQATCGLLNGGATASASGGTAPYSYSWNTTPVQTSAVLSGVSAGIYSVSVTDANGCSASGSVTITSPTGLGIVVISTTNQTCFGTANGQASVLASGGNAPYTYSWNTSPAQTSATASSLIAGTYSATVTDADGCSASVSVTIDGPSAPLSVGIVSVTNVLCFADYSGAATVIANGGLAPYNYSWNTVPPQTGPTASGLNAGTYTATVTDAFGCSSSVNVTLTQPVIGLAAFVESYQDETCFGANDGWATLEVSGGSGSWTIEWNTVPVQTGATATGLAPGFYLVTITDNNGCDTPKQFPVTIAGPAAPVALMTGTSVYNGYAISCPGGSDGSIDLTITGGTGSYTTSWTGPNGYTGSTEDISGLEAGTYVATVNDNNGCAANISVTLSEPSLISATGIITTAACQGASNGAVDATVSGGIAPYIILWNGPGAFTANSEDISGIAAGVYTLHVTDANGCSAQFLFDVTEPGSLVLSAVVSSYPGGVNTSCASSADGAIDVTPAGGTAPYIFLWTGPGGFTAITEDISGLIAGTYALTMTDANGCSVLGEYILTAPATLSVSLVAQVYPGGGNTSCAGSNDGAIDATLAGGTPGFLIVWSGPGGFTASTEDINSLAPGVYTITIWDVNGCSATAAVTIDGATTLDVDVAVSQYNSGDAVACNGAFDGTLDLDISGGFGPYAVSWTGPNGFTSNAENISGLEAGTYTALVADAAGCDTSITVTLTQPTTITYTAITSTYGVYQVSCASANDGSIDLDVSGGAGNYLYIWTGPSAFVATTQDISGLVAGTYDVTVTDMNGCSISTSFTLNAPLPIATTASITTAACQGSADGAIDLSVSGGVGPFTFAWTGPGGFNASSEDLSNLFAGVYTVTITDVNGCSFTSDLDVNQPASLSASATMTTYPGGYGVSCAGTSDGAIDLTAIGGTAPYFYFWTGPAGFTAITEDISGLAPGLYNLTLTDQNGCTVLGGWTVTAPTPINIGLIATQYAGGANVACTGNMDGGIDAIIIGGVTPYTIQWSGPSGFIAISEDITDLSGGTYTIDVVDAVGCTASATITLVEPTPIDVVPTASSYPSGGGVSCDGAADGSITLAVSGGSLLYFFNWTGPNGFTSNNQDISGLEAGTYTVTVLDANACSTTVSVTLAGPTPIDIALVLSQYSGGYAIGCNGDTTGTVDAVITGGSGAYTFLWTGPGGFTSTDENLLNVPAGTYTLFVSDAAGCDASATTTLTEPTVINGGAVLSDAGNGYQVGCAGGDGAIDLTVTGGNAPYTFDWTGTGGFASLDQDLTGLNAGTYDITVTDANGCSFSGQYTLTQAGALNATLVVTGNVCDGLDDGAIDVTVAGGVAPFNYTWTGPLGFASTDEDLDSLAGGEYIVSIIDAGGCSVSDTATIAASSPIDVAAFVSYYNGVNIPCAGDSSGVIGVTITGGAAPIDFAWSGPGGFNSSDTYLTGLLAGDYTITISDLNGCGFDTTITLVGPAITLSGTLTAAVFPSGTNISCFGAADGSIDATPIGGVAPYSFDWRGPDSTNFSTEDISGLLAGTYDLVITDANSCTYTTSITLSEPPSAIDATVLLSQYNGYNTTCAGTADGWIDVTVSGGNGGYTFLWSGPGGFSASTEDVNDLVAGSYTITITDMNGCVLTLPIEVTGPSVIVPALTPFVYPGGTNISCDGSSDGSITSAITGGATPYALTWSGPGGFTSNDTTITDLGPGTYCLNVLDANGCIAQVCVEITEPAPLTLSATTTSASCGANDGTVDLTVSGGTGPYVFDWSNGAVSEDIGGLAPDIYVVNVSDANGCSLSTSAIVYGAPGVDAGAVVTNDICAGEANGAIDLTVLSGTAPFDFDWSNGASSEDISGLGPDSYTITITDANGCSWSNTYNVAAGANIVLDTTVSMYGNGYNVSGTGATDGSLVIDASGGVEPYTYDWSNGASGAEQYGLGAGTYTVIVTDANGCSASVIVTLVQPTDLELPTGFSPNGDGHNDAYVVHGLDAYPSNKLVVFNRWGNVVFEQLNYRNDWSGENLMGEPLANGTYFVIVEVNPSSGSELPHMTLQDYVDLRR